MAVNGRLTVDGVEMLLQVADSQWQPGQISKHILVTLPFARTYGRMSRSRHSAIAPGDRVIAGSV